ncbi:hypothetical protein [Pseudoxanthomonas sp. 10H]|uniref:hypothetical protein n=1 Tax=Pseudoxanthomonas sp. 10H TaxID=3242729 RepID=UPI0035583DF7
MTGFVDDTLRRAMRRARLLALLQAGDVDAALQAGLMDDDAGGDDGVIGMAQAQLRAAWQARERFRAREARLAHRAAERAGRRQQAQAPAASRAATTPQPTEPAPGLPPAAAAALARARARAAGRDPA